MAKHIIQEDLDITLKGYVKKFENIPNRVVVTNSNGDIVVKSDLNVSQLDQLKNVTGDIQAQINNKSDVAHTHEDYLTLEELKDIDFSGVAEDIVYNPENSNLESTNVRDAIDEVDNKIEEYIEKLVKDKTELKEDIADTNQEIRNVKESIKDLDEALDGKASIDHTHEASEIYFEDGTSLQEKINNGEIGGSSSGGGDCNVIISAEAPTKLPIGGIWIDISNL